MAAIAAGLRFIYRCIFTAISLAMAAMADLRLALSAPDRWSPQDIPDLRDSISCLHYAQKEITFDGRPGRSSNQNVHGDWFNQDFYKGHQPL